MSNSARLGFDALNAALKAAGEETRLRVLALLAEAELTVSDLTDILRQSQPRISRHLKLLAEAGLVERFREGTWAFFRLAERGGGAEVARALLDRLDPADQTISRDRARLASVRQARAAAAQAYFRSHAAEWDRIRKLHVADEAVEDAIRRSTCRQAVPFAARSRHRHWSHARVVRRALWRGLGLDLRSTCWCSRATGSSGPDCANCTCGRATSTIYRSPTTPSTRRRASGAALSGDRRTRDSRGCPRVGAGRALAGGRFRAA